MSVDSFMGAARAKYVKRFGLATATPKNYGIDNDTPEMWRNAAGTADLEGMRVDSDNILRIGEECINPMKKTIAFNLSTNASLVDQCIFVSDGSYKITGITEIHAVAGNDASAVTLHVSKETGTRAPSAGVTVQSGTFDLKGTANTLQSATLTSTPANLDLVAGDRLSLNFTGAVTTLAGVVVTITLTPAAKQQTVIYRMQANGDLEDQSFFVANRPCIVTAIRQTHSALGTDGSAVTLQVVKDTATDAPGAGTNLLTNNTNAGFDLKGAINTVQNGTLTATAASLRLLPGDRLSVDFAGILTAVAGVVVVVTLQPIYGLKDVQFSLAKNANLADQSFFTADRTYEVIDISEVHAVAGSDAAAVSMQVTADKATEAPGTGTDLMTSTGFDMKGTANTPAFGTLTAQRNRYLMAGDRLSVDFVGTLTALAGVSVNVTLRPC